MNLSKFLFPMLAISFFLFICLIIFQADSGRPNPFTTLIRSVSHGDKAGHLILYGVLALLVNLALKNRRMKLWSFHFLTGSVLVATFAILEEFTQISLSTRNFELMDIFCDLTGILIFSYGAVWVEKKLVNFNFD